MIAHPAYPPDTRADADTANEAESSLARDALPIGSTHACAQALMDLVPNLMDEVRRHMRAAAPVAVSVPQMRLLIYARRHAGASLTDAAEHLGVTLPTVSVAAQRLIDAGWLESRPHPHDRRRSTIWLTARGTATVQSARRRTRAEIAARLQAADPTTLDTIQAGLHALARLLHHSPATRQAAKSRRSSVATPLSPRASMPASPAVPVHALLAQPRP